MKVYVLGKDKYFSKVPYTMYKVLKFDREFMHLERVVSKNEFFPRYLVFNKNDIIDGKLPNTSKYSVYNKWKDMVPDLCKLLNENEHDFKKLRKNIKEKYPEYLL